MFSKTLIVKARRLLTLCGEQGIMLATAESCTGGFIAALLTEVPGSSAVFERGFVTYSNAAKQSSLGVSEAAIKRHGAVSKQVAMAMAEGAIKHSKAQLSIAVTGVAGPAGGTKIKPVGLVYIAVSLRKHGTVVEECRFKGSRSTIRSAAVAKSLELTYEIVKMV